MLMAFVQFNTAKRRRRALLGLPTHLDRRTIIKSAKWCDGRRFIPRSVSPGARLGGGLLLHQLKVVLCAARLFGTTRIRIFLRVYEETIRRKNKFLDYKVEIETFAVKCSKNLSLQPIRRSFMNFFRSCLKLQKRVKANFTLVGTKIAYSVTSRTCTMVTRVCIILASPFWLLASLFWLLQVC